MISYPYLTSLNIKFHPLLDKLTTFLYVKIEDKTSHCLSVGMCMYECPLSLFKEGSCKISGEICGFECIYQKLFCKQLYDKAASLYCWCREQSEQSKDCFILTVEGAH